MSEELYTELILEHNKSKKNFGELDGANRIHRGFNASCGDDIILQMIVEGDIVKEAKYIGNGCAISKASTSILIDLIIGKKIDEANELVDSYLALLKGDSLSDEQKEALDEAIIFESLSKMPARVKCGTVSWHSAKECLK